jgi:hypothetical protein
MVGPDVVQPSLLEGLAKNLAEREGFYYRRFQ